MHFVLEAIEKLSIDFSAKFDPWSRLFGHQAGWKPVLNFAKLKELVFGQLLSRRPRGVEGIGMAGVKFLSFLEKIPMQVKYSINHYNPIQFHTAQHYYHNGTPVTSSSVREPLVLNAPLVLYIIGGSHSIAKCLELKGGEIHCHGANQWVATVQRIEPDMLDRGNVAKGVAKQILTHPRQLANPSFRSTVGNLSKALTVVTVQRAPANWPIGVRTTPILSAQPNVLGFEELCRALNQAGTLPRYEGKLEI